MTEFSEIIGRPVQAVSEILNAKKEITAETAMAVSTALGTTPEVWLNLQTRYRLHLQRTAADRLDLTPVARRARLRNAIPLAEARSRGWVPDTGDLDETELAVCRLLEIPALGESPAFALAARRSNREEPITLKQSAWLGHVRRVAEEQDVERFDVEALEALAPRLAQLLRDGPGELKRLPGLLAECGVCLVFCEGLRGGKLDGAVTFLRDGRPAIGLTTRNNRFDSLLFTLLHDCAHLTLGHITPQSGAIVDDDVMDAKTDPEEVTADELASAWLLPGKLRIRSTSVAEIAQAATDHKVHPSVVIGQIQRLSDNWSLHRARIPKVRPTLQDAGLMS